MTKLLVGLISALAFVHIVRAQQRPTMPHQFVGSWCQVYPAEQSGDFAKYVRLPPGATVCPNNGEDGGGKPSLNVTPNGLAPKEGQNPECTTLYSVFPEHNESDDYEIHFDCIDTNDGEHIDLPYVWRILRDGSLRLRSLRL